VLNDVSRAREIKQLIKSIKEMKSTILATGLACLTFGSAIAEDEMEVKAMKLPVTAEEQAKMTPDSVLKDLMAGNERFMAGEVTERDVKANLEASQKGQFPKAYVLSCVDSRVPVERVFDQGTGQIFVGRVAGNVETTEQLGSMEYAAVATKVKLIVVMGHESCGAVKGACDGVEFGNLTALLDQIEPAVEAVETEGEKNSKNKEFVKDVIHMNVKQTVADIRSRSEILKKLEDEGKIKIVGAKFSFHDGSVSLVE